MKNKRPYHYIELWKRKQIIECSITKSESIKKCAKRLGVKYITAKHIVKVFKETGKMETKIMQKEAFKQQYFAKTMNRNEIYSSQQVLNTSVLHYDDKASKIQNFYNPQAKIQESCMCDTPINQGFDNTNQMFYQQMYSNDTMIEPVAFTYQMPAPEMILIPVEVCGQLESSHYESIPCKQISFFLGDEIFEKFKL